MSCVFSPVWLLICCVSLVTIASAQDGAPSVKINEIMFAPDDDTGGEWIELYNNGAASTSLAGWTITNRSGRSIAKLPGWRLPAKAYLVISFTAGDDDDDLSDGAGRFHVGAQREVIGNVDDDIALYRGEPGWENPVDFVAYLFEGKRGEGESAGHDHAVLANMWPANAVFDEIVFVEDGNTIGRDAASHDTNTPADWWGQGGLDTLLPSPGEPNTFELGYELCALTHSLAIVAQLIAAPSPQTVEAFMKVLKQIREKHLDLLEGLGDSLMGNGDPRQEANGDIVVGRLRFVFKPRLEHHGKNAGGLTHPPKERGGEIKIELSESALDQEWKMKDAVLHEIGHAAQFQDALAGYWRADGSAQSDRTREHALKVHECKCYLSNLRLLCRFKTTGEFQEHSHDIDTRIRFKVGKMEWYLNRAIESLAQFAKNAETWTLFGVHLHNTLLGDRDLFLKAKLIAFKLPTEKERKAGKPGKLTPRERAAVKRQVKRWNSITPKDDRLSNSDVDKLLRSNVNDLIRELGTPPPAPKDKLAAGRADDAEKKKRDEQAAAAAKAERERVAKIRQQEKQIELRLQIARSARGAARTTRSGLKTTKELAEKLNYENNKKLVDEARKQYAEAEKRFNEANDAVKAIQKELKQFRRDHREELAYVPPRAGRRTLIDSPHGAFVTNVGAQAYASFEYFADGRIDKLSGMNQYLASYRVDVAAPNATHISEDLANIKAVYDQTQNTVQELTGHLAQLRRRVGQAGGDVAQIAQILTNREDREIKSVEFDPAVTVNSEPTLVNLSQDFRAVVFDRFAPTIAADLALQAAPQAGQAVVKGGAVVDQTSGAPNQNVTVTITVDLGGDDPGTDNTQSKTTKTDEQGQFRIEIPDGAKIVDINVGGEDVSAPPQKDDLDPTRLFQMGWNQEEWNQLDPQQRQGVLAYTTGMYQILRDRFSLLEPNILAAAQRASDEMQRQFTSKESRDAVAAVFVTQGVLGGSEESTIRLLGDDELRRRLAAENLTQPGEQARFQMSSMPLSKDIVVAVARKPEQIVAELDGKTNEEQLQNLQEQIERAVQDAAGADKEVTVEQSGSKGMNLPVALGGSSTVVTWTVHVKNADGSPGEADKDQLQQNLNKLAESNPNVRFAEAARLSKSEVSAPNDPHFASKGTWGQQYHDQWALRRIGLTAGETDDDSTWPDEIAAGKPCIVAVIGSGIDWTHPEMLGQMWINQQDDPYDGVDNDGNGYVDDQFGWNFRDNNRDVMDYGGHDTHVAGVIAARWNNGRGIAGINPRARIMALKVANYLGHANSIDISRAVFYAVDHQARVINISYSGQSTTRIEQRAIDYAQANNVLVVVAAGNESVDAASRGPAGNPGALTVAGATVDDKRAGFSNWGQPVDLSAPSMDVLSLRARGTDFLLYVGENPNYVGGTGVVGKSKDLYRASGTSFAAPFVSGVASLIWSLEPELKLDQVRNKLLMGCDDVEAPGWDQYTGSGVLNAHKVLAADPDHYLRARISRVRGVRREGKIEIEVSGQADGTKLAGRWLQIAFGPDPGQADWQTVDFQRQAQPNGLLGTIPTSRFDRQGVWSIRILVQDEGEAVRQGRATLNLK